MIVFAFFILLEELVAQNPSTTFVLTSRDAECELSYESPCQDWDWKSDEREYTISAGEQLEFTLDLSLLEGTTLTGEYASLSSDEGAELHVKDRGSGGALQNLAINGFFDCPNDDCSTYAYGDFSHQFENCDFSQSVHTFQIRNTGFTSYTIGIKIEIEGDHEGCAFAKALANWLLAVVVIFAIICGCGILIAILCLCGCVGGSVLCCVQANKKKTTKTYNPTTGATTDHTAVQMNTAGSAPPPSYNTSANPPANPAAPVYHDYTNPQPVLTQYPTEGEGSPQQNVDLTPYSNGLAPGWEAKWDPASNRPYWVDHNLKTSTWQDPRHSFVVGC